MDGCDPWGPGESVRLSLGRAEETAAPHCSCVPHLPVGMQPALAYLAETATCQAGVHLSPFRFSFLSSVTLVCGGGGLVGACKRVVCFAGWGL